MKNSMFCYRILPAAIVLALLLCHQGQSSWAQSSNNNWGAPSGGSSSSLSANADVSTSSVGGGSSASGSAQASGSLNGPNGSASADASANVSSGGNGSGDSSRNSSGSSGSLGSGSSSSSSSSSSSQMSGSSSSGSAPASAQTNISSAAQATPTWSSSTPKPEGFFGRIKEAVKTGVENLTTGPGKKDESKSPPSGPSAGPSQMPTLGSGENPSSNGTGIMEKVGEAGKKVKDFVKDGAKEVKADVKTIIGATGAKSDDSNNNKGGSAGSAGSGGSGGGLNMSGSVKIGGSSLSGSTQIGTKTESGSGRGSGAGGGGNSGNSGGAKHVSSPAAKHLQKIEQKLSNLTGKLLGGATADDVPKELSRARPEGRVSPDGGVGTGANPQFKLSAKSGLGEGQPSVSKSTTGEVFDMVSEVARAPIEAALKPLDKAFGMDKDPLIAAYDNSHEIMRKQLDKVAEPVEQMFSGAFKTSDEAKKESERLMSEQEKREMKMREERLREEGRSVLGEIVDRTYELAEKPYEIILKPVDRIFGFDKDGQKDPLLKLFEEIYNMSKRPIDVLAKPFENLLRKMGDGDQGYQVSVRVNADSGSSDSKLFTRLADGALNIAERVMTRPLEMAMRPLGYDGQRKKNPIVESTHQLKNATKVGFELITKPMDRIIKEISDIGASKSEAGQESDLERRRQEASRIVRVLDRLKDAAQSPWEIVLRPVSRTLGYSREGKKEPFLRAWDVIHEVLRAPIQVVSKPVEDALLGEQRRPSRTNVKAEAKIGSKTGIQGKTQIGSATASASAGKKGEENKKNIFVDGIKKIEKFAARPFDKITSPIRKLILGEDGKNGVKAKASVNTPGGKVQDQVSGSGSGEDKIVHTVENLNNVVLKPLEVVTQPISDLLSQDDKNKKGGKVKVQAQVKSGSSGSGGGNSGGSQNKVSAAASAQAKGGSSDGGHSKLSAAASAEAKGSSSDGGQNKMSASASAQLKKN